jgi:hypothetical protein
MTVGASFLVSAEARPLASSLAGTLVFVADSIVTSANEVVSLIGVRIATDGPQLTTHASGQWKLALRLMTYSSQYKEASPLLEQSAAGRPIRWWMSVVAFAR